MKVFEEVKKELKEYLEEEEEEDPIEKSLQKDYDDFILWAFGGARGEISIKEIKKLWKERHPNLPIPRVFETKKKLPTRIVMSLIFMDGYPLYLESKKNV